MRHLTSCTALSITLLLFLAILHHLSAASPASGQLWILTRGSPGPAMVRIASQVEGRILGAPAGGRVLVLHVDRLAGARPAAGDAWLVLRLPSVLGGLPVCG